MAAVASLVGAEVAMTPGGQVGLLGAIVYTEQMSASKEMSSLLRLALRPTKEGYASAKALACLDLADVSTAVASDTASPPLSPGSGSGNLLSLPWHDALSYFMTPGDMSRVTSSSSSFRSELTVEAPGAEGEASRRLLVVPVVELKLDNAEAALDRVSLPHIHVLRIWNRLSLVAAAKAAETVGKEAFRSVDRFLLKGCPLNGMDVKELLVPMLSSTKHLTLMNLERNQLNDAPIQQLCASGFLNRVETLNLRFNKIGDRGATAIAQCRAFKTMKWVNLKVNNVSDVGALALASALRHNTSMTLLNLRKQFPALTDKSAIGFAEMLETNSTLQQLRLRKNRISDEGAVALATAAAQRLQRMCQASDTLRALDMEADEVRLELDLEDNRIGDAGALALLRTACMAPTSARLEILLSGNTATMESVSEAAVEAGETLDSNDPRISFTSKPEFDQ